MLGLDPATLISRVFVLFIALTFHEFAHAWTAYRLGDDTARLNGRLTLNPLAHLDMMGSLMLLIAGFGWAKPVPINPYALLKRSPNGVAWVSLAGPLSNFLLAVLAAIPLRFHWVAVSYGDGSFPTLFSFLAEFMYINLALAFFNLLPIAPLDGEKILVTVLPPFLARGLAKVSVYGPIILLAVIMLSRIPNLNIFGALMNPVMNNMVNLLLGV
jgi:Zn-dependent protease